MYEIRSKDGKYVVIRDGEDFFTLPKNATYNGKKVSAFQSDDVYKITEIWNYFGGSSGNYDMVKVQ